MSTPVGIRVRFAVPSDLEALLEYEKSLLAAVPADQRSAYIFGGTKRSAQALTGGMVAKLRHFTVVAEDAGAIVGFAYAKPWTFPGNPGVADESTMLLHYLVVNGDRHGEGIGRALVDEIEACSSGVRQNLVIAHIPESQAGFYRSIGWEVLDRDRGYAWLPFKGHLLADDSGESVEFPLVAARVLRPKALRIGFEFAAVRGAPVLDAAAELLQIIDKGRVDYLDLDPDSRKIVDFARQADGKSLDELNPQLFSGH
jgi:GNAT superfamily N-acetyltransferase